nr:hypothetical protein [Tanacetum cinerariifolium]
MDDQEDASKQRGIIADLDVDKDVTLEEVDAAKDAKVEKNADVQGRQEESQAHAYHIVLEHAEKVLSMKDDEPKPTKLFEVIKVVTTAKLMTEVVTAATTTITVSPSAARRRKGVVIRDPEETATPSTIVHSEPKSKDKGKRIMISSIEEETTDRTQARKNMMVYLKNIASFKMDFFKGMSYDAIRQIFEKYFNSNVAFLEKSKEQLEEEESKALKRKTKSSEEKATKKQKLDEEVEELKKHLQIVLNDDDDVYIEATPLALKIVKERFASSKPKNFSDDFMLTLKVMFEKTDVEAQVWKNQRGIHGLAKVKSKRLLESYGVHIISFTTTQMILLVERRYPLTTLTLDQMLNNVRLEVEKESEVSLKLLRFVKRQQQEGYRPE